MKAETKKEIFAIPNIMGYFRLLFIPIFACMYLRADTKEEYYAAAAIIAISGLTDFFDGKIARKYNMITELGKALDPIADKLTLGVIAVCLTTKYELMLLLLILYIMKEGFMGVMGAVGLRKGVKLNGAMWFGKVCTFALYVLMFFLIVIPDMKLSVVNTLIIIEIAIMAVTFILYLPVFYHLFQKK